MKKIALFSDGTGNSSSNPLKTNVWRMYQALDKSSNQIAFYDNGVGTSSFTPSALLGMAFGWGLARNVKQIYGFLCRTYEPGDEIYCFGFSRGAFTIRVLVGLIASQGIIDRRGRDEREIDRLVSCAYRQFRKDNFTPSFLSWFLAPLRDIGLYIWRKIRRQARYDKAKNVRAEDGPDDAPLVKFVGVFDTVDAYGFPIDEITRAWDKVIWPLSAKDRNLSKRVGRACHALALDERRESFEPMLWNESEEDDRRIAQVWFPGVHTNVGGGYPDDGIAYTVLNWMLDESSRRNGLTYLTHERARYKPDPVSAPIYNNRSGVANLYRYAPRNLETLCRHQKPGLWNWLKSKLKVKGAELNVVDIERPKIHHSVFERIRRNGEGYAPINVPGHYRMIDADGQQVAPPESQAEASRREEHQQFAWNKVWGRKLLYFAVLVSVVYFLLYPSFERDQIPLGPWVGTFNEFLMVIPEYVGKIPGLGFAESWALEFRQTPYAFGLCLLLIIFVLSLSASVRSNLRSEMRGNWLHVTSPNADGSGEKSFSILRRTLKRFLRSPLYRNGFSNPLRIGTEAIAVVLMIGFVAAMFSRVAFLGIDGVGGACAEGENQNLFGTPITFEPDNPCFDTGLDLVEGQQYDIAFRVKDWYDDDILADVSGWLDAPWYLYLFTPIRRHWFADWYQPIARIDDKMFDRFPIKSGAADSVPGDALTMRFVARSSGRLFLYVNDAVLLAPNFVRTFYENNRGEATVIVEAIDGAEG